MLQSHSSLRSLRRLSVDELRTQIGLFSFQSDHQRSARPSTLALGPDLGFRAGSIIECLVTNQGSGAITAAIKLLSSSLQANDYCALIDPCHQWYVPALSGWGIDTNKLLLIRPNNVQETSWSIEQCLRSTGLAATLALVDHHFPERVHRRWQLAAEVGSGIGLIFRPASTHREPTWADSRFRFTPQSTKIEATRRLKIEVLYRRGGLGLTAQAWEIDHASGHVRLVS